MSSARPITPSSATDLCAETTSSMPGRFVATSRSPVDRVAGPAGTEHVLVLLGGDLTGQAEAGRSPATPRKRRLAPLRVVGQRRARMVVAAVEHRRPVVLHRLGTHHPHPRHRPIIPMGCPGSGPNLIGRSDSGMIRCPGVGPGAGPGVGPKDTGGRPMPYVGDQIVRQAKRGRPLWAGLLTFGSHRKLANPSALGAAVCLAVYVGSAVPLPVRPWERHPGEFNVTVLGEGPGRDQVRRRLQPPFIYEVGSYEGCACGFGRPYDPDEELPQWEQSLRLLTAWLVASRRVGPSRGPDLLAGRRGKEATP